MAAPRNWVKIDVAFFAQDSVVDLVEGHGPGGPLLLIALILQAKAHALGGVPTDEQGAVEVRWAALARQVGVTIEGAEAIVDTLVGLELVAIESSNDRRVRVRLLKWQMWEPKDSAAAARKRRQRARERAGDQLQPPDQLRNVVGERRFGVVGE